MKRCKTVCRFRMAYLLAVLAVLFLLSAFGVAACASAEQKEAVIMQSITLSWEGNVSTEPAGGETGIFILTDDLNMPIDFERANVLEKAEHMDYQVSDPEYLYIYRNEVFPTYFLWYIRFIKSPEPDNPQWFEFTADGTVYHVDVTGSGEPTWNDLRKTLSDMSNGQILRLPCDIKAQPGDSSMLLSSTRAKEITLDLNGHTLDAEGTSSGFALGIMGKQRLVIMDSSGDHSGKITGADQNAALMVLGGTMTLESGTVSGNQMGGVRVGGTYSTNGQSGDTGTFVMNGGSICNNESLAGGGVLVDDGIFIMNGGSISGNTSERGGGGVYLSQGSFTLTGGSIRDNTAGTYGGGVIAAEDPEFIISGAPVISGNTASGHENNVFLYGDAGFSLQSPLAAGTVISVAANISGRTVTEGLPGNGTLDHFRAEEDGWVFLSGSDGEAMLGKEAWIDYYATEESTEPVSRIQVLQDQEYVLPDPVSVTGISIPDGKVFYGWKIGEEFFDAGEKIVLSQASTSICAVCSDPYWTIEFAAGYENASGIMKHVKVLKGNDYTLPACGFGLPEGHSFAGWKVGEETKAAEEIIPVTENMTVTALWSLNWYTVTFSPGEGTGEIDPVTELYGTEITLPACTFTAPEGKTFGSWSVEGKNPHYYAGDTFVLTGDTLVQPRWVGLWGDLQRRIDEAEDGAVLSLEGNTLAESNDGWLIIPENRRITLDLNGYTLDRNLEKYAVDSVMCVRGSLTIRDSSAAGTGTITGGTDSGLYVDGGSVVLESGTITGNSGQLGGGINVERGSVIMSGGSISHNIGACGAGIVLWKGSFQLSGGAIRDNTGIIEGYPDSTFGGGVYLMDADFTMTGGVISGNNANSGGGICLDAVNAVISGGEICDNTASDKGGGIMILEGHVELKGGSITGNRAESYFGGGIYVDYAWQSPNTLDMSGGTISGNYAGKEGGGIGSNGSDITLSGGSITGNRTDGTAGGCNFANGHVYLNGSPRVTGNTDRSGDSDLDHNRKLIISGELTEEALIGIIYGKDPAPGSPIVLTEGLAGKGTVSAFFSNKNQFFVGLNSDGEAILAIYEFGVPAFTLPAGPVSVGESAFEGNPLLTIVDAGHCTVIGENAFRDCANLTQIRLPQDCQIDPDAFDHEVQVFAPSGGTTEQCCNEQDNLVFFPVNP